ncbi:MAG: hypothetical protein ABJK37_22805 [Paraglaciecola sp.]|uniref:hypothetical protein n=1 Tax=Paraglaciecola sp. TaxID=1920173 RepID=UPI0032971533
MIIKLFQSTLIAICVSLTLTSVVYADDDGNVRFSGFARVVAGYIDEEYAEFNGYEDRVSLEQQSLFGMQADYQIIDNVSATAQVIGRTGDDNKSGIEWLYFTYAPTKALKLKLGRQRTPVFSYSDFSDVGFAYEWVSLPQQVYQQFLFPNFDGLHAQYEYVSKSTSLNFESYYGELDREFTYQGDSLDVKVSNMFGIVSTLGYESWTFRASFHQGDADVTQQELSAFSDILRNVGFTQSADSLSNEGVGRFYQLSAFYENVDYFFRSEVTRLRTELFLAPDSNGYFISGGMHFYPFSIYTSLSRDTNKYSADIAEIPIGVNAQLDQLALGYQQIVGQIGNNSTVSYSVGGRWDWKDNLAFKAQATLLKERDGYHGLFTARDEMFGGKAMFYQLALEWVF